MLNLKKAAVTGGLSCGKTTACRFFKELGAYVVIADEIVHQLLSPKTSLGQQVISLLGNTILVNGQIDRSKIAKKVFTDRTLLESLQNLLHPAVMSEIKKEYQKIKDQGKHPLFVAEVPLLFEISADPYFDYTVAVVADPNICRNRFKAETGYGDDEYEKRMSQQMAPDEKAKRADYVLANNGNLKALHDAVVDLYNKFINP